MAINRQNCNKCSTTCTIYCTTGVVVRVVRKAYLGGGDGWVPSELHFWSSFIKAIILAFDTNKLLDASSAFFPCLQACNSFPAPSLILYSLSIRS